MSSLRSMLVGFLLGGAFGAKLGAYIALTGTMTSLANWSLIELGFGAGALLGLGVALVVVFVKRGALKKNKVEVRSPQVYTKAA